MHIFYVDKIDSTQDYAKSIVELHSSIVPFWIQSGIQLNGKGQRGRKWYGDSGNLYITGCFARKDILPGQLSIAIGVLLANIIQNKLLEIGDKSKVGLKWPNDILINGKKCGGILIEISDYIYIGIGINLTNHPEINPNEGMQATHLSAINLEWLKMAIVNSIDEQFFKLLDFETIQKQWFEFAKDCIDTWHIREPFNGQIIGIDSKGQLLIQDNQGNITARHQTFV